MRCSKHASQSSNRLSTVLRAQKQRVVGALMDDETMTATPVLRDDETLCYEEYVTLLYEFHHVHLPELAAEGLIWFDRRENVVGRGDRFDGVRSRTGDQ